MEFDLSNAGPEVEPLRLSLRLSRRALLGVGAALAIPGQAFALNADRLLRLVVPAEPGGGIDSVARLLVAADALEGGRSLVVNRPGASGNLGTAQVANAPADGETILVTGSGFLTAPRLLQNAGFEPKSDFSPLCRLALAPNVLLVPATLQRVHLTAGQPDGAPLVARDLAYGSAGYGHSSHLAAELLKLQTRASWTHVAYKGTAPALRALMAGEVQIVLAPLSSALTALQTGKVHAVAVAHGDRLRTLPDVPTLREIGIPDADFSQWYGLFLPRGASSAVLDAATRRFIRLARSEHFLAGLERMGLESAVLGKEQFERFINAEDARVRAMLKKLPLDRPPQ